MHYAFDLDGTLIDTKHVLRSAYEEAGVSPPADFFGKPFFAWFKGTKEEADEVRRRKHDAYRRSVVAGHVISLPLMHLYKRLTSVGASTSIVTGASPASVQLIAGYLGLSPNTRMLTGCTMEDKAKYLSMVGELGIMFEDDRVVADYLRSNTTGWTICCTC